MLLMPVRQPEQGAQPQGKGEGGQKGPSQPVALEEGNAERGQEGQAVKHQQDAEQPQNGAPMHGTCG